MLPNRDAAFQTLVDQVDSRVFFQKCAAAGYVPRTYEEANWMLATGRNLAQAAAAPQVKAAANQDNFYFQMHNHLGQVLAAHGLADDPTTKMAQARAQEAETSYSRAAVELMGVPEIYNATLTLKAGEAEDLDQLWRQAAAS
jgi:hypothetical protein